MGMEVAVRACFPSLSHPLLHNHSSYPSHHHHHHHQTISSVIPSISSSPCSSSSRMRGDRRSPFLGAPLSKTRSLDIPTRAGCREKSLRRAISATSFPCFPDGDELQDLAAAATTTEDFSSDSIINREPSPESNSSFVPPSCWPYDEVLGARPKNRAASSTDLMPVSLRTVKDNTKNRFEEDGSFRDACETARCSSSSSSVKRAFSSMVFIIRELQSYSLHQMRELSFLQDLQEEEEQQGTLSGRMQVEMHASFVWLFQHIFSCTPALMLSLMLLVANLSIYSMGHHTAANAPPAVVVVKEGLQQPLMEERHKQQFGNSTIDTLEEEEEAALWKGIVDETRRMAGVMMDPEILQGLVSPVTVEMEAEDEHARVQTELMYRRALSQDPDNTLLLTNFAQFLYLVLHDYDRAESYFKLAVGRTEGEADAEALSRYASFLWLARKDLGAAEETFLEAIAAADPGNTYHAANYAHFLWNTGGEDTCYPLDDDAMGDHGGGCVCP